MQLTLLRTFRRWDRAREAPEAYSRTVLVNVCRERWRHAKRHPEVPGVIDDAGPNAVVMSFAEAADRRHVLVRVLRRLPDVQREVLVFRYLLDASVADTASGARHRRGHREVGGQPWARPAADAAVRRIRRIRRQEGAPCPSRLTTNSTSGSR